MIPTILGLPRSSRESIPFKFSSTNLTRIYIPVRGLPFSLLAHGLVFLLMVLAPAVRSPRKPLLRPRPVFVDQSELLTEVMYLPRLESRAAPAPAPAAPEPVPREETPAPAPSGSPGLSYPGPQRIVSDPPQPTNPIQTLLQPDLEDLPILRPPLSLPNMVLVAGPEPAADTTLEEDEAESEVAEPEAESTGNQPAPEASVPDEPEPSVEPDLPMEPDLPVEPAPRPPPDPQLAGTTPSVPLPAPIELSRIEPLPPSLEPPPQPELQSSLAVTSLPELRDLPVELTRPADSGSFPQDEQSSDTITSPEPDADQSPAPGLADQEVAAVDSGAGTEGGSTAGASNPSAETADGGSAAPDRESQERSGEGTDPLTVLALTPLPAMRDQLTELPRGEARGRFVITPEPNLTTTATEAGSIPGDGPPAPGLAGTEADAGGTGSPETGEASASPSPVINITFGPRPSTGDGGISVSGSGSVIGSPAGESNQGTATGDSPFAGITIVGGPGSTGSTPAATDQPEPPQARRPLKTSYGVFIISTESSGGGLPSFGVFTDDQVYTVYLDMREAETDTEPPWTIEFALAQPAAATVEVSENPEGSQQGLVLPFPVARKQPDLPAEILRRYPGTMAIVYAVVNTEGRMEQLSVKDSPDPGLNDALLAGLAEWTFRPALLDGQPVAMKALLGIPLTLSE